jgi:hypothetical protein
LKVSNKIAHAKKVEFLIFKLHFSYLLNRRFRAVYMMELMESGIIFDVFE